MHHVGQVTRNLRVLLRTFASSSTGIPLLLKAQKHGIYVQEYKILRQLLKNVHETPRNYKDNCKIGFGEASKSSVAG